jgi:hypothetical protein
MFSAVVTVAVSVAGIRVKLIFQRCRSISHQYYQVQLLINGANSRLKNATTNFKALDFVCRQCFVRFGSHVFVDLHSCHEINTSIVTGVILFRLMICTVRS